MNPIGFECENQVLNIKEVEFVEQVRCYKTTEEVCSMVTLFWIHIRDCHKKFDQT